MRWREARIPGEMERNAQKKPWKEEADLPGRC